MKKKSKFTEEQKTQAIEKVKSGSSYSAVAKEHGTHASIVRDWCLQCGVKSKGKKFEKKVA